MQKIEIKFELNKELDKHVIWDFLGLDKPPVGGIDFAESIFRDHPYLMILKENNKSDEENWKVICDYVDDFYERNIEDLNTSLEAIQKEWRKDESDFFDYISCIFKDPEVSEGEYAGYLSIINCNPRFLHNKTFQVFYKHKSGTNYVIAHEVLHFFFYDYANKRHSKMFAGLDENTGIYWDLAELFDVVAMSASDFMSNRYFENIHPYPEHAKYLDVVRSIWDKGHDIDRWIVESYEYINSQPVA
jgi:hypothetical protein